MKVLLLAKRKRKKVAKTLVKKEVTTNNPKQMKKGLLPRKVSIKYFSRMNYLMLAISPLYQIAQACWNGGAKHFLLEFHTGISRNGYLWEKELIMMNYEIFLNKEDQRSIPC